MKIECAIPSIHIEEPDNPNFELNLRYGKRHLHLEVDEDGSSRLIFCPGPGGGVTVHEPSIVDLAESLKKLFT